MFSMLIINADINGINTKIVNMHMDGKINKYAVF